MGSIQTHPLNPVHSYSRCEHKQRYDILKLLSNIVWKNRKKTCELIPRHFTHMAWAGSRAGACCGKNMGNMLRDHISGCWRFGVEGDSEFNTSNFVCEGGNLACNFKKWHCWERTLYYCCCCTCFWKNRQKMDKSRGRKLDIRRI